ncbi:L-glutamate gamma-semialdehyde dehydrogenase [Reyranella sp.]|nr:L-glutamate gamma-semialdehyde dehydrogenase [Reyranella sp.]
MTLATTGLARLQPPENEIVRLYAPGTAERAGLQSALRTLSGARIELPLVIEGREVTTGRLEAAVMPHTHRHVLADAHVAEAAEVQAAVEAAKRARHDWAATPWEERAAIFLRAADLLAGPWRDRLNAATMLGQSKTAHQAEIDSAAELIDFWRFNVDYMRRLLEEQPLSSPGVWNRVDYRPLEGFVYAATPFNFTAIAGNLPTAPALMGNTVIWKPSANAKYSAHFTMALLREAGLPDGVINLVYGDGAAIAAQMLADPDLAGVHFTGSTEVFRGMLRTVGQQIDRYRTFPRIVGETGGKNFILAHPSADLAALATAVIRGAFEYQGQKCSAASRLFVPASLWPSLRERLCDEIGTIAVGAVDDFRTFMGAVIDERAWTKHMAAFARARQAAFTRILAGGTGDRTDGYFVQPTLIVTEDVNSALMVDEFFGPIVTAYVYPDRDFESILRIIDRQGAYGLTGAVFATERQPIALAMAGLRQAAGNFYVNDKPTGAVVGQQPFGGARASGTNDKAGSIWNLIRWLSPRAIKETFTPPHDYRYPSML